MLKGCEEHAMMLGDGNRRQYGNHKNENLLGGAGLG